MDREIEEEPEARRAARRGVDPMTVRDGRRNVVYVGRDPSGSFIELQTAAGTVMDQPGGVLLTPDGARRLAAAILFEAGRLEKPARSRPVHPLRRTA
jgi:hypothetical protein